MSTCSVVRSPAAGYSPSITSYPHLMLLPGFSSSHFFSFSLETDVWIHHRSSVGFIFSGGAARCQDLDSAPTAGSSEPGCLVNSLHLLGGPGHVQKGARERTNPSKTPWCCLAMLGSGYCTWRRRFNCPSAYPHTSRRKVKLGTGVNQSWNLLLDPDSLTASWNLQWRCRRHRAGQHWTPIWFDYQGWCSCDCTKRNWLTGSLPETSCSVVIKAWGLSSLSCFQSYHQRYIIYVTTNLCLKAIPLLNPPSSKWNEWLINRLPVCVLAATH